MPRIVAILTRCPDCDWWQTPHQGAEAEFFHRIHARLIHGLPAS